MVIIFCYCVEKGCLNNLLNFSFCAPQNKCSEQRVNIHVGERVNVHFCDHLSRCGSSEMFFRETDDDLMQFKLREPSACLKRMTV